MPLSTFILDNLEALLDDWTAFARSIPAARELDLEGLRDHAEAMLRAIAADMQAEQTPAQQQHKSEGRGTESGAATSAAGQHGSARLRSGFEVMQMVAEFRALRATVVRQWLLAEDPSGAEAVQELIRFNEGLDQAIAESLSRFVAEAEEARELFLGVVAHDMRSPIAASLNAARFLKRLPWLDAAASSAVDIVVRSDEQLGRLAADVLDFVQLGRDRSLRPAPVPTDLRALCESAAESLRMSHPEVTVTLDCDGDASGEWDVSGLERLLSNLLENAVKHGARAGTVAIRLQGAPDTVLLSVWNAGEPIPVDRLARVFEPMTMWVRRGDETVESLKSYGLGLFIGREIVHAHGGSIGAESSREGGTRFTVRLPRRPAPAGG